MMRSSRALEKVSLFLVAVACATTQDCGLAAGAAVGITGRTAQTAYLSSRGAKSLVDGSIDNVTTRTRRALSQMQIHVTETIIDGDHRKYKGVKGGDEVTVTLARNDSRTTTVEVNAQRNQVSWDQDLAKAILVRIIETKA